LDRADDVKRIQQKADAEELKQAAEKQHITENTTTLKEKAKQFLTEQKRKDASPYKVSVHISPTDVVT